MTVDDEVYLKIKDLRIEVYMSRDLEYAYVYCPDRQLLHRHILGLTVNDGKVVDHINQDTLDNRVCNLRVCQHSDNLRNRGKCYASTSSVRVSKYKGVCFERGLYKYKATLRFKIGDRKCRQTVLYSKSQEECAFAYDYACSIVAPVFSFRNNVVLENDRAEQIRKEVDERLKKHLI